MAISLANISIAPFSGKPNSWSTLNNNPLILVKTKNDVDPSLPYVLVILGSSPSLGQRLAQKQRTYFQKSVSMANIMLYWRNTIHLSITTVS